MNFLLTNYSYESIDDVECITSAFDEVQRLKRAIAYAEEFLENCENDIQTLKEDLEEYLIDYHIYIDEFLENYPNADIEKEINICQKWLEEYEKITQTE